ncbi:MAG: antitoxin family protein [Candidatus Poribacteria bacterium]|nr:antitoxin family protein [Candidatus Poribacteria bacterium]
MAQPKKIRATYKNGVIEPLDKLNLPEGQELELEFKVLLSATTELSKEEKRNLMQKMRGSMKGTWGSTVEEVDNYLKSEREAWNRKY